MNGEESPNDKHSWRKLRNQENDKGEDEKRNNENQTVEEVAVRTATMRLRYVDEGKLAR